MAGNLAKKDPIGVDLLLDYSPEEHPIALQVVRVCMHACVRAVRACCTCMHRMRVRACNDHDFHAPQQIVCRSHTSSTPSNFFLPFSSFSLSSYPPPPLSQLGGNDAEQLRMATDTAYSHNNANWNEINLNCGCPSERYSLCV